MSKPSNRAVELSKKPFKVQIPKMRNFKVSLKSDCGSSIMTGIPDPLVVQIRDGIYKLNSKDELVFDKFTNCKSTSSVSCVSLFNFTFGDDGIETGPNINLKCKELKSVVFNGIKAQVKPDKESGKSYCVFKPKKTKKDIEIVE